MTIKIKHKRSAVSGKQPLPADLDFGEIAVNYHASGPAIYLKDTDGAIRKVGSLTGALVFKGTVAPTSAAPASRTTGDIWIMNAAGVMAASWIGVAGVAVVKDETIAWDGSEWISLGIDPPTPDATEAAKGVVELATAAETTTGTDATRAVHPAGLKVELDKKANLASPTFTGTPAAPTAAVGTNTTQVATTAFVHAADKWTRTGTTLSPATAGDTINGQLVPTNGAFGFRNRIINGAMQIDFRGLALAVSSGVNALTYTLDRWSVAAAGAAVTAKREGTPSHYWMNVKGAAGNTAVNIRQRIESFNVSDLAGTKVTVSFQCSGVGVASVDATLSYATVFDNFAVVTAISKKTIAFSGLGNTYTATFDLPAAAVNGVELMFSTGAIGAGQEFNLSEVQLEEGPVATPFEHILYGQEIALCQRYYEAGLHSIGGYAAAAGANATSHIGFQANKRAVPTVTIDGLNQLTNATAVAADYASLVAFRATCVAVGAGQMFVRGSYIATCEL